jgi:hypothetical protein
MSNRNNRKYVNKPLFVTLLVFGISIEAYCSESKAPDDSVQETDPAYVQHLALLQTKLPRGFHVAVEKPFVVIGNEARWAVNQHAHGTIYSAVKRLMKDFFKDYPAEIIDVWLFGDDASYRRYALELFGDVPDTPYGYYLEEHNALVMNVGTGEGTLIHEIVHPFMRANFPNAPPWLNEGLASLYEYSTTKNGGIWGLTNWRLTGLKRAIHDKRLLSFQKLMSLDTDRFYDDDSGVHYAEARFLMQYLQEKGLLKTYYHAFVAALESDPTGYETLKSVLNQTDMTAFQSKWEKWVMTLSRNP